MKETGIIFTGDSVPKILADLKTQTRRVIKPQPQKEGLWTVLRCKKPFVVDGKACSVFSTNDLPYFTEIYKNFKCPYGGVGDLLWVRENIRTLVNQHRNTTWEYGEFEIEYLADGRIIRCPDEHELWWRHNWHIRPATTIPSIFMPKWAARIWLEITNVRVERVQEINVSDCLAEGAKKPPEHFDIQEKERFIRSYYQGTWDILNAKRGFSWEKNPYVWVLDFVRTRKGK